MLKINPLNIRNRFLRILNKPIHRFKSSSGIKKSSQNEYQNTLNLPNAGDFGLSMKNICKTEDKIKKVAFKRYEVKTFLYSSG